MKEIIVNNFNDDFITLLPDAYKIMKASNLIIANYVYQIILTGSRGIKQTFRDDSDIDISILVDIKKFNNFTKEEIGKEFNKLLLTIEKNWKGVVEIDPAIIFDIKKCQLKCFNYRHYDPALCNSGGIDCCGVYKINKGFNGFLENFGVAIKKMYPSIIIWKRA